MPAASIDLENDPLPREREVEVVRPAVPLHRVFADESCDAVSHEQFAREHFELRPRRSNWGNCIDQRAIAATPRTPRFVCTSRYRFKDEIVTRRCHRADSNAD